ncbi:heparinase II/III family protein [Halomonas mongoliensis]|uniref:heparinase II/III family protein n=1 Tax=Halomonas mongoliensis TaxID=321265 RepID=UPI00403B255F
MSPVLKAKTAWRLGPLNIARVVFYKLGVRSGLNPVRRLSASMPSGPFFTPYTGKTVALSPREGWWSQREAFGLKLGELSDIPPDWHAHSLTGEKADSKLAWWQLPDFNPSLGDIKGVWEASRFDWVLACAQRAAAGDDTGLSRLNAWLEDWLATNPPYMGVNWKCGQEASIRVMHLAMAALILEQTERPASGLVELVALHLQRIAPTLQYAMAQDNNHGTSEAAALFIGGSWLHAQGDARGQRWEKAGPRWLENRAARLIVSDGTFSQYSTNYHRVMLDTLCMAEVWRRHSALPPFSERFYQKATAATAWLGNLVDPESGDAPNLGANDGARLLPLTDTDYRDYRPTVQLASVLFVGAKAYEEEGSWNLPLAWLGINLPAKSRDWQSNQHYARGGLTVMRQGGAMALLRYPCFRFRPAQSDLLHLDLWHAGENLLRDGGSYSYNAEQEWQSYFPGAAAHNTIQFDRRDQMPRLGRFLFGAWPKVRDLEPLQEEDGELRFGAGYRDWQGASHHRRVSLSDHRLQVTDAISGFAHRAVLRWRLMPGDWQLEGDTLTDGRRRLTVTSTAPVVRRELVQGWESRYYSQKTPLPVLEVELQASGTLTTELTF